MIYYGNIYDVDLKNKLIVVKINKKLKYFYLQNNLFKKFNNYLYPNRFLSFDYDLNNFKIVDNKKSYLINHFIYIVKYDHFNRKTIFYDILVIRNSIKDLINNSKYNLFLDLEMTMQDYTCPNNFVPEIIQAGIVLTDNYDKIIKKVNYHIKPTKFKITKRTKKFLSLDNIDEIKWVSYDIFYETFNDIINKYQPNIYFWGRNDLLVLKSSFEINKKEHLESNTKFINLLQLIKNYYNLKNDLGLVKAYNLFTNDNFDNQIHDALEDASLTYKIFEGFKYSINK